VNKPVEKMKGDRPATVFSKQILSSLRSRCRQCLRTSVRLFRLILRLLPRSWYAESVLVTSSLFKSEFKSDSKGLSQRTVPQDSICNRPVLLVHSWSSPSISCWTGRYANLHWVCSELFCQGSAAL